MGLARTLLFFASFVALFRHLAAEYNTWNTPDMGFKDVLCLALISTAVLLLCSRPLYDGLRSDVLRVASRLARRRGN